VGGCVGPRKFDHQRYSTMLPALQVASPRAASGPSVVSVKQAVSGCAAYQQSLEIRQRPSIEKSSVAAQSPSDNGRTRMLTTS
jgi:hypothetical protein